MMLTEFIEISPSTLAQLRAILRFIETQPMLPELKYKRRQLIHKGRKP